MLSAKQDIKYHFLSFWYDSTWDWTPVSVAIGEHSTQLANQTIALQKQPKTFIVQKGIINRIWH